MTLTCLSEGSQGPIVGYLQDVLRRAEYLNTQPTYAFDEQTKTAVQQFQKQLGLEPDGIVGAETWEAFLPYLTGNFTYTVKPGNTLSGIAKKAGITLRSLLAANPLINPDELYPGQKIAVPFLQYIVPTNLQYSSDIMHLNISALRTRYPFLQTGTAGYSVLGKSIPYIRIGTGKNVVFYNASHHANEWITSLLLVKFIEMFCYAYVNNTPINGFDLKQIFEQSSIYLIPMVNPDGVDLVTGALDDTSSAYRYALQIGKKYPDIPFPSGWKANIAGTDLNLNYPAGWQKAKETKEKAGFFAPAPRDYVGPYPFSEPESRAVAQFTASYLPSLILAYHAQGEIIYWKYADYDPEGSYEIAQEFSRLSGYTVETTPEESGNAGYKDWFIQQYNRPGYTIEVGKGQSPLPLDQFSKIYHDNIGILLSAATATL